MIDVVCFTCALVDALLPSLRKGRIGIRSEHRSISHWRCPRRLAGQVVDVVRAAASTIDCLCPTFSQRGAPGCGTRTPLRRTDGLIPRAAGVLRCGMSSYWHIVDLMIDTNAGVVRLLRLVWGSLGGHCSRGGLRTGLRRSPLWWSPWNEGLPCSVTRRTLQGLRTAPVTHRLLPGPFPLAVIALNLNFFRHVDKNTVRLCEGLDRTSTVGTFLVAKFLDTSAAEDVLAVLDLHRIIPNFKTNSTLNVLGIAGCGECWHG